MPSGTINLIAYSFLFSANVLAQGTNEEVRCTYQSRQVCSKKGCTPTPKSEFVSGSYVLVPSLLKLASIAQLPSGGVVEIRLCDAQGCLPVLMHVSGFTSGDGTSAFLALTQANRGPNFMKLYVSSQPDPVFGLHQGDFIEGEESFLTAIIGFGHCQFPKP
jgi:hypothetical protein